MKVSYFPGCTLKTKAKKLDIYARRCAEVLGVTLEELDNWQCCGGVFSMAKDEIASKLSSVRALADAKKKGQPLVTVCSACHNVIKQTNHAMQADADFALRANNYLMAGAEPSLDTPYRGETQVVHYLELLRDVVGFDKLREAVVNPLKGQNLAAYYGCLLLRPSQTMRMDDPENPGIFEDFLRALGAEPVVYPYRNECCGGYVALENAALTAKKSSAVLASAKSMGAERIVTACPLCRYNLEKNGNGELPVVYLTEILAEALGVKEDA
ncbi:MAG: CoB--CoM heterodisulfide reductase iron-sulfur subunit B family protein [Clostridiaceae bacterium]|nr:CoB--CoM heterodisulfide reductase iron-sulfur subunit B family protein [Clostridiaceae bacterium]